MTRLLSALSLLIFAANVFAINISKGRGALLYDTVYSGCPNSSRSNSPGHWIPNIQSFNQGAASSSLQITRLYPYSGDIEMYCSTPNDCVFSGSNQNVYVYYNPPASGQSSVAAYRAAFPSALILAIIDGSTQSSLLKPLTYSEIGTNTAILAAQTICPDEKVDGIFYDIEKFDIEVPGQFALYKQSSIEFSSSTCIDSKHPNGRVFGVFLNPNKVTNWGKVAAALGTNGFVAVSAYDVRDTTPPIPVSIQTYTASITGMLEKMDAASAQYNIRYTVVVPAASSFSEFGQYGVCDTSLPNNFKLIKDYSSEGITQLGYITAVRAIIKSTCKSPHYLGEDYWSWSQYKSPNPKKNEMLMPEIPDGPVVQYLQQNGT